MTTTVHRCATCGAPLSPGDELRVECDYCGSENSITRSSAVQTTLLAKAVREADGMQADVDAKSAILQKKLEEAFMNGNRAAALKYQEGIMRLAFAPTIHMYQSFDPGDPQIAAALQQIDDAIDAGMRATAESWGVDYVPVAERSS